MRILNIADKLESVTVEELSKRFSVSRTEIIQSIMRLEQLTGQTQRGARISFIKALRWIKENW